MSSFDGKGWADPDTRAAGLIVLGALVVVVLVGTLFRDVNAA